MLLFIKLLYIIISAQPQRQAPPRALRDLLQGEGGRLQVPPPLPSRRPPFVLHLSVCHVCRVVRFPDERSNDTHPQQEQVLRGQEAVVPARLREGGGQGLLLQDLSHTPIFHLLSALILLLHHHHLPSSQLAALHIHK